MHGIDELARAPPSSGKALVRAPEQPSDSGGASAFAWVRHSGVDIDCARWRVLRSR
jgi:hypothetical protein